MKDNQQNVAPADNATEPMIYSVGSDTVQINLAKSNGRIADQASAARSIILYAALKDRSALARKAAKATDLQVSLGLVTGETAQKIVAAAQKEFNHAEDTLESLRKIMHTCGAFTVPQGSGSTTPQNVIKTAGSLLRSAVSGAQAVLQTA